MPFNFKEWYKKHGKELNETRRRRYQEDPGYKARVLTTNQQVRERKREQQDESRRLQYQGTVVMPKKVWKTTTVRVGGEDVTVYSIGAVAKILGFGVQVIRKWEIEGRIPPAFVLSNKGDRLFTLDQLETIKAIAEQQGLAANKQAPSDYRSAVYSVRWGDGSESEVRLFRVGYLALAIRRAVLTIGQMERNDVLPATPLRYSSVGYRLYTADMIEAVKGALERQVWNLRGKRGRAFRDEVEREWTRLRVIGAEVLGVLRDCGEQDEQSEADSVGGEVLPAGGGDEEGESVGDGEGAGGEGVCCSSGQGGGGPV